MAEEGWNPGPSELRMLCHHKVKMIQLQSRILAWVWEGSEVSISNINYYSIPKSPLSSKIIFNLYLWYRSSGKLLFILQNLTQLFLALYSLPCPSPSFNEWMFSIPELFLLLLHISASFPYFEVLQHWVTCCLSPQLGCELLYPGTYDLF